MSFFEAEDNKGETVGIYSVMSDSGLYVVTTAYTPGQALHMAAEAAANTLHAKSGQWRVNRFSEEEAQAEVRLETDSGSEIVTTLDKQVREILDAGGNGAQLLGVQGEEDDAS